MTTSLAGRDLLTLADFSSEELQLVLDTAKQQKRAWAVGERDRPLSGGAIALILQKPSLRTRVSFEVACARLGLHPVTLAGNDSAFSRGETIHDTARVLERYVDCIVIRTYEQSLLAELAEHSAVPVINALTDEHHPCQGLADLLTIDETFGHLNGIALAYVGDGNNMAHTYLLGGAVMGMDVRIATPAGFEPVPAVVEQARVLAQSTGAATDVGTDPVAAVTGAHVVATDTWASMGQEAERDARLRAFRGFTVDSELMGAAAEDAIFLHCLPAHRGEEVTDDVIDGACSAVFDEAENRLHAQEALLSLVLDAADGVSPAR